jgi:hypothetical protein
VLVALTLDAPLVHRHWQVLGRSKVGRVLRIGDGASVACVFGSRGRWMSLRHFSITETTAEASVSQAHRLRRSCTVDLWRARLRRPSLPQLDRRRAPPTERATDVKIGRPGSVLGRFGRVGERSPRRLAQRRASPGFDRRRTLCCVRWTAGATEPARTARCRTARTTTSPGRQRGSVKRSVGEHGGQPLRPGERRPGRLASLTCSVLSVLSSLAQLKLRSRHTP